MAFTDYDPANYNFAEREKGGTQRLVLNNLGRAVEKHELVNLGGYFGEVADTDGIANGAYGYIDIAADRIITTEQVEATDTFTAGNTLYFEAGGSSAAGKLVDTATATTIPVGKIVSEQGTTGAQISVAFRPFVQGIGVTSEQLIDAAGDSNAVKVARVIIDAATDYSTTGKETSVPIGAVIVDVKAIATATASGGTAQVFNGASAVHTAIVMAADGVGNVMAAGIDDTKLAVTAAVTVKTHALGDAGIVEIFYI
jgi:hypothetical protein